MLLSRNDAERIVVKVQEYAKNFANSTQVNKVVVLPLSEFEKMRPISNEGFEDMLDVRIINEIKSQDQETISGDFVNRIFIENENPIRVYREYSMQYLANKVDITQGYLSNIETGKREGTISLYQKLALALDVAIEQILLPLQQ